MLLASRFCVASINQSNVLTWTFRLYRCGHENRQRCYEIESGLMDMFHRPCGSMRKFNEVMQNMFSKIILGTAQLGMPYGLGCWKHELMPESEVFTLLDMAWEMGITTLDTSPDYGIAEERIAKYLRANAGKSFHIISKIKHTSTLEKNVKNIFQSYFDACPFTNFDVCSSLSILLHKEADIHRADIVEELDAAVQRGQIMQWGASVYGEGYALDASEIETCSIIQLPFGVLNQSFGRGGCIDRIDSKKTLIHARSVFTQGLLFFENDNLQDLSPEVRNVLKHVARMAALSGQSKMQLGLRFVLSMAQINGAIIGVDKTEQLSELSEVLANPMGEKDISMLADLSELVQQDDVKPEKWGRQP